MFWPKRGEDAVGSWIQARTEADGMDQVHMSASLRGESHAFQDVGFLVGQLQHMVDSVVVARLLSEESEDVVQVQHELETSLWLGAPFPLFHWEHAPGRSAENLLTFLRSQATDQTPSEAVANDPVDVSLQFFVTATASWLRAHAPRVYYRLGGAAQLQQARHESPVVFTVGVALGAAFFTTGALVWGGGKVAAHLREDAQVAKIREAHVDQARADARTAESRATLADLVVTETQRMVGEGRPIPEALLANAALLQSPAIHGLARSPLIGELNVSLAPKL